VSEQLEVRLDDRRKVVPWDGVSPRDLTKAARLLYLRREPGEMTRTIDLEQSDLFDEEVPMRRYLGAPTLFPL